MHAECIMSGVDRKPARHRFTISGKLFPFFVPGV
jgi:hypothetical protein